MGKAFIVSLLSLLSLLALPSPEGHQAEAFVIRCFVDFDYDLKREVMEKNLKDSLRIGFHSGAYHLREERQGFQPYVAAWASESQPMAGVAARWGNMSEAKAEGKGLKDLCEKVKARFAPSRPIIFIRIHSFMYFDAARGEPIRCPIRILQGTSPFRRITKRNTLIPELANHCYSLPMSRILFDFFEPPSESRDHDSELPPEISSQWLRFPEVVRKGTRAIFKGGTILLSLPLAAKGRVLLSIFRFSHSIRKFWAYLIIGLLRRSNHTSTCGKESLL